MSLSCVLCVTGEPTFLINSVSHFPIHVILLVFLFSLRLYIVNFFHVKHSVKFFKFNGRIVVIRVSVLQSVDLGLILTSSQTNRLQKNIFTVSLLDVQH